MGRLKTDDLISRRIVKAFLDFLSSVEPAPGVDVEGLEVARECLAEVFDINSSSADYQIKPNMLVEVFKSMCSSEHQDYELDHPNEKTSESTPCSSSPQTSSLFDHPAAPTSEAQSSKDELFGQFFAALERAHFFQSTPDGNDDMVQLDKVTCIFHDALAEMEGSGCKEYDKSNLAEALKSLGNKSMQSKLYSDAIELYTCAVALCQSNAIYYSNRAAAYTQIGKYEDAIKDCHKSIEIDPNYWKAYSRLGMAYYALGRYAESIDKGFKKALQLNPDNESIKENVRVAEQKLKEESQSREWNQGTSSSNHSTEESNTQSTSGSRSHGAPPSPPFTSFSFGPSAIPANFANMFMNMAGNRSNSHSTSGSESQAAPPPFTFPFDPNAIPADFSNMFTNWASTAHQGHEHHSEGEEGVHRDFSEPEIRIDGNIDVNMGEHMPEELTGALRSVMEMFTGAASRGNAQDGTNGRSPPS